MPTTLIIDDDEEFIHACRGLLDDSRFLQNHRFFFARDDRGALAMMHDDPGLDVALVSLDSKAISGMDLFPRLGGDKLRIPRIAITSHHDLGQIRSAMNKGAADFLVKPVEPRELALTIERVYGLCEERRRAWRAESRLAALHREIEVATDIQKRILPGTFPRRHGLEVAARLLPARGMSGDFYDVFEIDSRRIGMLLADVTGHGVPAAFIMAVAHTLIRAVAPAACSPADCISRTNDLVCRHDIPNMLVSVFYCVLDTETWRLEYANGGHPLPLWLKGRGERPEPLDNPDGVILGVETDLRYRDMRLNLAPGDGLLLYTDGVTEAFNPARAPFAEQRLQDCLTGNDGAPLAQRLDDVVDCVVRHRSDAPQRDDIALLGFQRRV